MSLTRTLNTLSITSISKRRRRIYITSVSGFMFRSLLSSVLSLYSGLLIFSFRSLFHYFILLTPFCFLFLLTSHIPSLSLFNYFFFSYPDICFILLLCKFILNSYHVIIYISTISRTDQFICI